MILPVEKIRTDIEGDIDPYAFRKLAHNFYSRDWTVRYGDDFENNVLLHLTKDSDRKDLDKYTKMKLGRSRLTDFVRRYNEPITALGEKETELLLHVCRTCSYVGGPGIPDILLFKGSQLEMRQLNVSLQENQIIFLAVAKQLGYGVALYDVETSSRKVAETEKEYDAFTAIRKALDRKKAMWRNLMEEIRRNKAKDDECSRDEAGFLENENKKLPFSMLQEWLEAGEINTDDVRKNFEDTKRINSQLTREILKLENALKDDNAYWKFSRSKTEENIKKKVGYLKNRFNIGTSKAIRLFNLVD